MRSGGQKLAKPLDVSKVLWLVHDLTGVEVDLHHAGELNRSMSRNADDERTVRFGPDLFNADVPEPHLVFACGGHPIDVGDGQVLRADRSIGKVMTLSEPLMVMATSTPQAGLRIELWNVSEMVIVSFMRLP